MDNHDLIQVNWGKIINKDNVEELYDKSEGLYNTITKNTGSTIGFAIGLGLGLIV